MAKVFKHHLKVSTEFAATNYFKNEIIHIEEQIEQLILKKELFQKMLIDVENKLCPTCKGEGKTRISNNYGSSELIDCVDCNGTGLKTI